MANWTKELGLPESESRELIATGERALFIVERMDLLVSLGHIADMERVNSLLQEAKSNIAVQEAVFDAHIAAKYAAHKRATALKRERIGPIQESYDKLKQVAGAYLTTALKEDGEYVPLPKGMTAVEEHKVTVTEPRVLCLAIAEAKVPLDVIKEFSASNLKAYAKQKMELPGCIVDMELNVRVKKEG